MNETRRQILISARIREGSGQKTYRVHERGAQSYGPLERENAGRLVGELYHDAAISWGEGISGKDKNYFREAVSSQQ